MLSSPALDIGMTGARRALLATLETLTPNLGIGNGLDATGISRDPAVVAAYRADPLVHDRIAPRLIRFLADAGPTVRALGAALAACRRCCSTPAATASSCRPAAPRSRRRRRRRW